MSRIDTKRAVCIGISAALAIGLFAGPASARWGDNGYNNNGYNNNNGNHGGHDWNNNGYYYRDPPVIYNAPNRYYHPPPVVYGQPQFSVPGISIQIR
jgi:hypothetical protein